MDGVVDAVVLVVVEGAGSGERVCGADAAGCDPGVGVTEVRRTSRRLVLMS